MERYKHGHLSGEQKHLENLPGDSLSRRPCPPSPPLSPSCSLSTLLPLSPPVKSPL